MWVRRFESSSGDKLVLLVKGACLPLLALAMAPLMAAKGAGVSETRRGKTDAAISRALLPTVTVGGQTVDMEAVHGGGTAAVGERPAVTGITPGAGGLVAAAGLAAEAWATAAVAACVILTIAAAADAGTCALNSPEIDSGEDGGVNVCTDWPVLATNFKGYGSIGKDGRVATGGNTTLLPLLSRLHTLIVLPTGEVVTEEPLLLTTQLFVTMLVVTMLLAVVGMMFFLLLLFLLSPATHVAVVMVVVLGW